jgi:hypothetical protein
MERSAVVSRKRSKDSVSSQSDVPAAKKKKITPRDKEGAIPSRRPSSTLPTPSPSPPLPPPSLDGPSNHIEEDETRIEPSPQTDRDAAGSVAEGPASSGVGSVRKRASPKLAKNHYLKPQRSSAGSWMVHVASLVVHRCAQRAEACGLDPRGHLREINWSQMMEGLLRPQDLHLIWYLIGREYSDRTVPSILDSTRPYSELSVETLLREEIRVKYKDAIPKPPLTAYMLFTKSKHSKLKQKYPNLQMTEVAVKLGELHKRGLMLLRK